MSEIKEEDSSSASSSQKPQVFLSHRHADKETADIIRDFIRNHTGGKVNVFQSSYSGSGPEIGKILTEELGEELDESEVVLLIFTVPDEDWSYCMWETGVAFNPRKKDETKIVVLQCGQNIPAPLSDKARVQISDKESVKAFVRQFLTDTNFFPLQGKPISEFNPESEEIKKAGEKLFDALKPIVSLEPDKPWSAWPLIRFRLPLTDALAIKALIQQDQESEADTIITKNCLIYGHDSSSPRLFGVQSFNAIQSIEQLILTWQSDNPESNSQWSSSLIKQIKSAVRSRYPSSDWSLLRHAESSKCYVPILFHVCESPSRGYMEFDFYFPRLDTDEEAKRIKYDIPNNTE